MNSFVWLSAGMAMGVIAAAAFGSEAPAVERSDVVFMGPKGPEVYKAYEGTMVSWGGHAWGDNPKAVEQFRQRVKAAHDLGLRYCAGLAFRTAFASMIDFDPNFMDSVCRTLDGKPITVPWLWDHKHKGYPAYWFCTNSPGYRKYLLHQTDLAMAADVEGLHIDDYNGTAGTEWQGGCFCKYCMAAFRQYLAEHVPAERLKECGVASLEDFDYGQYLRERGVTTEEYRRKVASLPLGQEYLTFQYRAAAQWVHEVHQYAEKLVGHRLLLSVNSSASNPKALVIAPQLSYFCGEVNHQASTLRAPTDCLFVYKMGDALGKRIVCTASGYDWAYIKEHQLPGLVRLWIAQAYAYGHQLMVPHRQWAYTKEKGTHWYQSSPSDYAFLYRFVRDNAQLFDGYEAVAPVGVLYSNAAFRAGKTQTRQAALDLARDNVPFRLVVAGDDWLTVPFGPNKLSGLKALVYTEPLMLIPEQQAVVDEMKDQLVKWPEEKEKLFSLVPRQVLVEGGENIAVVPRVRPGDKQAPFICQVVNYNYDPESDGPRQQRKVVLRLHRTLLGDAQIASATVYAPNHKPRDLAVKREGNYLAVTLPRLDLWAVVALYRK